MRIKQNYIAFTTIFQKEIVRFARIWIQTILPPAITMTLYFIIFGQLIGSQIGSINGYTYMQYIAPGLIMMAVITNSYANVVSSFYGVRFQKNIEEMLVSPMPNSLILLGYVMGGVIRGLVVGLIVALVALFFTHLTIHSFFITFSIVLLASLMFSLAGFTNALFAKRFDDISLIPTFVLTPLTYLGGVFYSIHQLPAFWKSLALANPILHMVNAFRYGILGITDVPITSAFVIILSASSLLFAINLFLLHKGVGIRT